MERVFTAFLAFVAIAVLFLATRTIRRRNPQAYERTVWIVATVSTVATFLLVLAGIPERLSDVLIAVSFILSMLWMGLRATSIWRSWRDEQ